MQIIRLDPKDKVRIKINTMEDLWTLKQILRDGDIIGKKDMRTVQIEGVKDKKPAYLKLKVEKVEFEEDGKRLKVLGPIIEAPEYVSKGYHSFKLRERDVIDIWKEKWKKSELIRLKEATKDRGVKVLICVVDEREADFAIATEKSVEMVSSITARHGGKAYGDNNDNEFLTEIRKFLEEYRNKVDRIIIAGPGFKKEDVYSSLGEELKKKSVVEAASVTGRTGINEVIKRGALDRVIENMKISQETRQIENLLAEIGKESKLVAYGFKEVEKAAECGAVSKLLISENLLRDERVERILETVEKMRGEIVMIHTTHDAGRMFEKMGGIAAFLRYELV